MTDSWAIRLALLFFMAAPASGCGEATRVGGTVTYEGKPVENGRIVFLPADGQGPSAGGEIVGGQYEVRNLTPGRKTVQITATREAAAPIMSLEEIARKGSKGAAPPGLALPLLPRTPRATTPPGRCIPARTASTST